MTAPWRSVLSFGKRKIILIFKIILSLICWPPEHHAIYKRTIKPNPCPWGYKMHEKSSNFFFYPHPRTFLFFIAFREEGRGSKSKREIERERNFSWLPSHMHPNPDQGSNLQPVCALTGN